MEQGVLTTFTSINECSSQKFDIFWSGEALDPNTGLNVAANADALIEKVGIDPSISVLLDLNR
jgi:hypothetical protein